MRQAGAILLGMAVAGLCTMPVLAQKAFLNAARGPYQLQEKIGKCTLCHEASKGPKRETLNVYGKALQAEDACKLALGKKSSHPFSNEELAGVLKAMAALDTKDSDGDGATNKEEMALGTWPGDGKSAPDAKLLAQYREAQVKAAEAQKKKESEAKK